MTAKCVLTIWELNSYQRRELEITRKASRRPHICKTGHFTPKIGRERLSANVQETKTTGADCVVQKCCFLMLICKLEIFSPYFLFSLPSTDESRSIGDRESYLILSIFYSSFYKISMNVPAELTIVSVKEPFAQIHLAPTSARASLVIVETGRITAFQTASI